MFASDINKVIVPDGFVNAYVNSETTAFPIFRTARIATPSATPAVRYVNVSGTFLADVPITIGKLSTLKNSGLSVDVVIVDTVLVVLLLVVVVSVVVVVVVVLAVAVVVVVLVTVDVPVTTSMPPRSNRAK